MSIFSSNAQKVNEKFSDWQDVKGKCPCCGSNRNKCRTGADGKVIVCTPWRSVSETYYLDANGMWQAKGSGARPAHSTYNATKKQKPKADRQDKFSATEKYFNQADVHSADYWLRPWAERLGVSTEGLRRVGSQAHHGSDEQGGYLISIAPHWCDADGYTSGGFAIRFENPDENGNNKKWKAGLGCGMWGRNKPGPFHCCEGHSDGAVLAQADIPTFIRPNNQLGAETAAKLIDADRMFIVWGENDARPTGETDLSGDPIFEWPGMDGAERVATRYANITLAAVSICLPPKEYKDIRDWWRGWCIERGHIPHQPTAPQLQEWREMFTAYALGHATPVIPSTATRRTALMEQHERITGSLRIQLSNGCSRYAKLKKDCICAKLSKDNSTYTLISFKIRCKCNKCDECGPAREYAFLADLHEAWANCGEWMLYRSVVDEDGRQNLQRRIKRANGEYAYSRLRDGKVAVWSNVETEGSTAYTGLSGWTQLHQDCRSCYEDDDGIYYRHDRMGEFYPNQHRRGVSDGWRLDDEPSQCELLGYGTEESICDVAAEWKIGLSRTDTPEHRDYMGLLMSDGTYKLDELQQFALDVADRDDPSSCYAGTSVHFTGSRSQTSVSSKSNKEDVCDHRTKDSQLDWLDDWLREQTGHSPHH